MSHLISDGVIMNDGDNPDLESAFSAFAEELKTDTDASGYIKVHKLPLDERGQPRGNSGKQIFLFDAPMGDSTVADVIQRVLRDYFLPGEMTVTIRVTGHGGGRPGVRFQRIMTLQKPKEKDAPTNGTNSSEVANLLRIMQENSRIQTERTEQFMREMMQMQMQARAVSVAPAVDPLAMMQQVGAMMGVFQTMFSGARPPLSADAADPFGAMVKNLQNLKTVQKLLGNDAPADDGGVLGIIKALTPIAGPALQMMANSQVQRASQPVPVRRRVKPAEIPVETPAPIEQPPAEAEGDDMNFSQVKQMLTELCDMAESGADATAAAGLVMDALPENADDQMANLVSDPVSFFAKICALQSRCKDHAEWFEALRVAVAAEFE